LLKKDKLHITTTFQYYIYIFNIYGAQVVTKLLLLDSIGTFDYLSRRLR